MKNFGLTPLGAGAGLRHAHFDDIISQRPPFRWFEIINEDFMNFGGYVLESLREIRRHYQIIGHGVCLAIGSTDPLDLTYLKRLRKFLDDFDIPWTSDHLCFTMVDHTNLNDLIPLPFTSEAATNVIERVKIVQQELARPFLLENVTRYITVSDREMSETEFINTVLEKANCGLLLDVTNAYLNSKFHGFDPLEFVRSLPLERVGQMHLAGWERAPDGSFIDSHDAPVPPEVWDFFKQILPYTGPSSVIIEWDAQVPPVHRLLEETLTADAAMAEVFSAKAA
ncbi:MAG: DUF692 domain-containing protein [Oligoflexia bacterium]|nr:DUF692 domain-containing protein [Oligoflexia bacterium]